jgi:hypothetical protein
MAKDVVALLTESEAWIDPNLVSLAGEKPQEENERRNENEMKLQARR